MISNSDIYSPEKRSEIMRLIRGHDTKPELVVRSVIHRLGFRFRLHTAELPGRPDIVLSRLKKVVFVHGCFWHQHPGCPRASLPKTRTLWWKNKLTRNFQRDIENQKCLRRQGWRVLVIWQCKMGDSVQLETVLLRFLRQ
jgi:DNA mismatch endonuclease, patch repair protein